MARPFVIFCTIFFFYSCAKVNVQFTDSNTSQDPNISVMNNYLVNLDTYKKDSVPTSGDSLMVVGTNIDPLSGKIQAMSFSEVALPSDNPLKDNNVTLDSVVVILFPNGNYYGDTTAPYTININQLTQNVDEESDPLATFYNPHLTQYDPQSIGSLTTIIQPNNTDSIQIKLTNQFSSSLFNEIKKNTSALADQQSFRSFLKGIALTSDTVNNRCIYQFSDSSASLIRIYYTLHGLYNEAKYMDLNYLSSKQYNHIDFDFSGSLLEGFPKTQTTIISSEQMGNYALANNYIPTYIKVSFPNVLSVNQTHSFVKVMNATLSIRVKKDLNSYPYVLPDILLLYVADNDQLTSIVTNPLTGDVQTGNLKIDNLLGSAPTYTYDITDYINQAISEGTFSNKSLYIIPGTSDYTSNASRLVLTSIAGDPDVQLKLYVLGL